MARTAWQERIGVGERQPTSKTGRTRKRPVLNEFTGKVGGYQIDHADGRMDAIVKPETLRIGKQRD